MERQIIRPELNVPVLFTLDFDEPLQTEGMYGPEWQYKVNADAAIIWLPEAAKIAIDQTGARRGDTVSLTKGKNGRNNTWKAMLAKTDAPRNSGNHEMQRRSAPPKSREPRAERPAQPAREESRTQSAARSNDAAPSQSWPLAEQLLPFLRAAIIACSQAEKESQQNGCPVEFGRDDIRALAITLYIEHRKAAR